jgi:FAD synthetase
MKKVMIFGTFDIIHGGHLHMFTEAREYGDNLIAVVGRDENVEKVKGTLPVHNQDERLHLIKSIRQINEAVLGDKFDVYKVIEAHRPDVIALGYDQKVYVDKLAEAIEEFGLTTKIVKLKPHQIHKYKSSKIKQHIERII